MQNFEVCTTLEQLTELAPSWDGLDTYLDAPVGKYRWILSCAESLTADAQLYVPVIRNGQAPVAMAPLVRPHGLLGGARQLGVEFHGEPGDFSYKDIESLSLLAKTLAENRVPLVLTRTPADSPVLAALRGAYRRRGFVVLRPRPDCPYIEIEATEDRTSARLPASLRSDLRRASRRAEKFGAVSLETHAPASESDLLPLWEVALEVEAAGWKGRSQSALQLNRRVGPFYRSYAIRACEEGTLRILFLRLGSDIASMMIALEASERFWILKIGYDERFATCSPGMLLMHEALRHAARQRLRSYEFLGTAEDWTRRWTDCGRPTHGVFIYPYTVKGAAIFVRHTAGFLWRKLSRRLKDA